MHDPQVGLPVDGSPGPSPRRRSSPRELIAFSVGVAALFAALGVWLLGDGPTIATRHGFIAAVPLTILGIVLVTVTLLRGSWAVQTRRAAQLAVLQRAANRMSGAISVSAVGRVIVEETRRLIDYHNARVYLLEPPYQLLPIAFEGRVGAYERVDLELLRTTVGEGFTGWVAANGRPLRIDDANADPRGSTIPGTDDVDESMLIVPMHHDGTVVGVITLSKLGLRRFDDDDLRLLTILADQAATALAGARSLAQTRRLADELRRLLDMSSDLSGSLDPRQVANHIASHLGRAMEVDETAISYWDRGGDRLLTLGYHPPTSADELQEEYTVSGFPVTRAVLEEQRIAIVDVDDPAADPSEVAILREAGMRSLVMLPLVAKGQSVGVAELMSATGVIPDADRLELARTMANEAGMALENARLYEDARRLADRDPLTGFFNHRYLHERLGEEVVRSQRTKRPLSVLMLDLDDFKLVNDTFGHLFGDRVLQHVAALIRSALRASDVPARYGGDEFAVILPETDGLAAERVAERIAEAMHGTPFRAEGRLPVPVAGSIGIATLLLDGRTATELIAAADRALYRAKEASGRDPEGRPALRSAGARRGRDRATDAEPATAGGVGSAEV